MEDQDYILFDDYITGMLSKEERLVFENRLKSDSTFKENFDAFKELSRFLENRFDPETNAFTDNLKKISNAHFDGVEDGVEKRQKNRFFRYGQFAMAASIVILLGVFIFNQFSDPAYGDYNNHETISLTVRGVEDSVLKDAEKAFNSKNFTQAEMLFNKILSNDPSNLEVELYKSIALIEMGQVGEADELLRELSETNSAYGNKAKWYWAMSKLKQKEFEECVKILKTIPKEAKDYKRAEKLWKKLQ